MQKLLIIIAILLLLLTACNKQEPNQSASSSLSEASIASSLDSADSPHSAPSSIASSQNTQSAASSDIPVPKKSESFEESLERFILLLEHREIPEDYSSIATENNVINDVDYYYSNSCFYGTAVEVLSVEECATEEFILMSSREIRTYTLTLDIHETQSPLLETGIQQWVLILCNSDYLLQIYGIERFLHISKYDLWVETARAKEIELLTENIDMGIGRIEFASPKEIPVEVRGRYLLSTIPEARKNVGYIDLETADKWSRKIFGEDLDRDISYDGCEDIKGSDVLGFYAGGKPFRYNNFFLISENGNSKEFYYEWYDYGFGNMRANIPDKILQLTVIDDIIYSVKDVTNEVEFSMYAGGYLTLQSNISNR